MWPCSSQDRVLINRLDNLCTLVLSGQWPSGRRYVSEAHLNPSSELVPDEMAYSRMIRKPVGMLGGPGAEGEDGEFTVKLLKVCTQLSSDTIFTCVPTPEPVSVLLLSSPRRRG